MSKQSKQDRDLVSNRRALHDYEILETCEAGIVLLGTEIKALRMHTGSLSEAHIRPNEGALWLLGASIPPYRFGNVHNHEEKRDRKLLLHHREIEHFSRSVQEKGLTLIPLALYLVKGRVKVKVALAKGKHTYDKRASLQKREEERSMQRTLREHS